MTLPALIPASVAVLPDRRRPRDLLTVTVHALQSRVVLVAVSGEVDLFTGPALRGGLLAPLRNPIRHLIVDLTDVGFFDAAGITVLIEAREAAVAAGIGLSIVANTRPVLMPLNVTGMVAEFDIHPDRAHAVLGVSVN